MDWWALGILIFEMLAGYPPFFDDNPFGIYEKILSGKIDWPRQVEPLAKDLIKKLLVQDRTKRLGKSQLPRAAIRIRKICKIWDLYQSVTWCLGYKILKELKKFNAGIFFKSPISNFTL